jgi:hypothetical protein
VLSPVPRILPGREVAPTIHEATSGKVGASPCPTPSPVPQCGAPARISERFWLESTDGPVEHLKIGCLSKHWFTPPAETIQQEQVISPDRDLVAQPS